MRMLHRTLLRPAQAVGTIVFTLLVSAVFTWRVDLVSLKLKMNAAYAASTRQEISVEPAVAPTPAPAPAAAPRAIFGTALALESFSHSSRFIIGQPFIVTLHWRSLAALPNPVMSTVRLFIGPQRLQAEQSEPISAQTVSSAGLVFTQTIQLQYDDMDQLWYAAPPLVVELEVSDLTTRRRLSLRQGRVLRGTRDRLAWLSGNELQASECSEHEIIHASVPLSLTLPLSGTFLQGFWYAHHGIDIAGDVGRPVLAMQSGRVVMADWNSQGYGLLVKLQHDDISLGPPPPSLQKIAMPLDVSLPVTAAVPITSATTTVVVTSSLGPTMTVTSLYGHLSRILVREGQWVQAGQIIGTVGLTGRTTGPHLHVELRVGGVPRNPLCYLPPMQVPTVLQTL